MKSNKSDFELRLAKIGLKINGTEYLHFEIHPYYIPFIGERFIANELRQRVLFVGESHYISDKTNTENVRENRHPLIENALGIHGKPNELNQTFSAIWYSEKWLSSELKEILENHQGKEYYTTRGIAEAFCKNDYKGKAITQIFGYPLKSMHKDFFTRVIGMHDVDKKDFEQFAYMNFFQRPSLNGGDSIHYTSIDADVATKILNEVIRILGVDKVFIMSKISYDAYVSNSNCQYAAITTRLAHPCSRFWKNKSIVESLDGMSSAEYLATYFKNLKDTVR